MSLPNIALVSTQDEELDIVIPFVNYHLNIGVDHIYLFLEKGNVEVSHYFSLFENVTCFDCKDVSFYGLNESATLTVEDKQSLNAMMALDLAKNRGCEWLIHIDSDELIYTTEPLKQMFSMVGCHKDVVLFSSWEAIPNIVDHINPFTEISAFRLPLTRQQNEEMSSVGLADALFQGTYFRGHEIGKSAMRTSRTYSKITAHFARNKPQVSFTRCKSGSVLHYFSYSFENWKKKYKSIDDFGNIFVKKSKRVQKRLYRENVGDNQSMLEIYKRIFFLDDALRTALTKKQLLTELKLDQALFEVAEQ